MSKDTSLFTLRDIYPNYVDSQSVDDKASLEPADQKEMNPDQVKPVSKESNKSRLTLWIVVFITLIALYHIKGEVGA